MLRLCMCVMLALFLCSPAIAQQNEVAEHFRAYRAALDRHDLDAAEIEAELALAASEARDGDGGSTGILALNLATTRLLHGDAAAAVAPAQRAYSLAQAGAAGLDEIFAALVLGRAELADSGRPGADRLLQVLGRDDLGRISDDEIYPAASELGAWGLRERDYETAIAAWSAAAAHAPGSEVNEQFGYARARTWQAAALFFEEIGRSGRRRMDVDRGQEAYRMLAEAIQILQPMANQEAPNLELTIAQRAFAESLALRSAVRAKLVSDHLPLPTNLVAEGDADGVAELNPPLDLARPRCLLRLVPRPMPHFPSNALAEGNVAGLVLRLRIAADGSVQENEVVARVGEEAFASAAERVSHRWHVERRDDSQENCRMESVVLVPVSFAIG